MSNSLDLDQARRFVGPDQGPNCLPRLSADDTGRQRVNTSKTTPDELITDVDVRSELILTKQMLSDINKTIN